MAKMNKNEIKQILDKIELTSQDRAKLAEYISQAGNEVPEEFKNWSGAANFLNNNNEPGGMINMPFGYSGGEYFSKEVNLQPNERALICNLSNSWYYRYIVVSIDGKTYELKLSDIKDTEFNVDAYHIICDSNTKDFYIQARPWMPLTGTVMVKIYDEKTKLSNDWLDGELEKKYGNTNEEEFDNLIDLLNNGKSNIIVDLNLLIDDDVPKLIRAKIIKTLSTNRKIYGIMPESNEEITYIRIDGHTDIGFDFNKLKVGKTLKECNIGYTILPIGIPDWDNGVKIKNRTHYRVMNDDYDVTDDTQEITHSYKADTLVIVSGQGVIKETYIPLDNTERHFFSFAGATAYITRKEKNKTTFIVENPGKIHLDIKFGCVYKQLPEYYIPDTIARTDNYERPHIKFSSVRTDYNLSTLSTLGVRNRYICDLYFGTSIPNDDYNWAIQNGEYFNGVITGIQEGKLVQYDVNFETGEITEKLSIDLELIGSEVKLDVCSAGSTEAARNLELLNKAYFALGDHFTVNIDAGIGVAKFIPETGGEGHITTAAGVNVHYTIGADGSVTKTMEIDIVELYNKVEAITITVDE